MKGVMNSERSTEPLGRPLPEVDQRLQRDFLNVVKILSGLIDMRFSETAGHGRRCAELCEAAGVQLNLSAPERVQIRFAALLHSLGKMALSDVLLAKKPGQMTPDELAQWKRYPGLSEEMVMGLEQFAGASQIIRSHQERWDGRGFPDQLRGQEIPIGARVLAAAIQMDRLRHGWDCDHMLDVHEVNARLRAQQGKRLCPEAGEAMIVAQLGAPQGDVTPVAAKKPPQEVATPLLQIQPGSILARDLVGDRGLLLLGAHHELTAAVLQQLGRYERRYDIALQLWVRTTP